MPAAGKRKRRDTVLKVVPSKKRRMRTTIRTIRQPGLIVPDKLVTTMVYSHVTQQTPGVAAEDFAFNLNSIFDPNRTGVGHQPMGRDQLAAFYNRYRVTDCKWVVDIVPQAGVGAIAVVLVPNNEAASLAGNIQTAIETTYAQYKVSDHLATSVATDERHLHFTGSMHLAKLYGVTDAVQLAENRFAAEMGADPAEIAVLHVITFNLDGNAAVYNLLVRLIYTVECYDRIQLSAS